MKQVSDIFSSNFELHSLQLVLNYKPNATAQDCTLRPSERNSPILWLRFLQSSQALESALDMELSSMKWTNR